MIDHYEVFVISTGRTLWRTHSESVARILADGSHYYDLDWTPVDASGNDIPC